MPPFEGIDSIPHLLQELDAELSRAASSAHGATITSVPSAGGGLLTLASYAGLLPATGFPASAPLPPSAAAVPAAAVPQAAGAEPVLGAERQQQQQPGSGIPPHIYAAILATLHSLPVPLAVPLPLPSPVPSQLASEVDAVEDAVREFVARMPPVPPAAAAGTAGTAATASGTGGPPGPISTQRGGGRDKLGMSTGAGASSGAAGAAGLSTTGFGVGRGAPNSAAGAAGTAAGAGTLNAAGTAVLPGALGKGGTAGTDVSLLPSAGLTAWLPGITSSAGGPAAGVLGGPIYPPTPDQMISWGAGAGDNDTVMEFAGARPGAAMTGDGSGSGQAGMTREQLRRLLV